MKNFKKIEVNEIQAAQYGKDEEANEFVELCRVNYEGVIKPVPRDMLGTPKDAFKGVKTVSGWTRIAEGDWIVQKDGETFIIPDGVFRIMFAEV